MIGLAGDDVIFGGFGSDTLVGGGGSDLLSGGAGADTLTGGTGRNTFFYEAVADSSTAANSVDLITDFVTSRDRIAVERLDVFGYAIAVAGTETRLALTTTTGQLLIRSANTIAPADIQITTSLTITGTNAAETLAGLNRNDTINGLGGIDTIFGNDGNDTLKGGAGNDVLAGDNGDDRIEGEADNDSLRGGAGNDVLLGGAGVDNLSGDDGNDRLEGGTDADTIDGGQGADTIEGGDGSDLLTGTLDTTFDEFGGSVTGDRAIDTFLYRSVADSPATGDFDAISGFEAGFDIIDARGLQVTGYLLDTSSLLLRTATGDLRISFTGEIRAGDIRIGNGLLLTGSTRSEQLEGLDGNDVIEAGDGRDFLIGNLGNDTLRGEAGFDTFVVDAGDDLLDGGRGIDAVDAGSSSVAVTIDLALGTLRSANGNDTLVSIENARGGDGDDTLIALDRAPAEIEKFTTISTNATAQPLDGRFGLDTNTAILNGSSVPHVTVYATSSTGPEIYAVTAAAGAQMVVDIDDTVGFDSFIEIRNSVGTRLAFNDNQDIIDSGSVTNRDSILVDRI